MNDGALMQTALSVGKGLDNLTHAPWEWAAHKASMVSEELQMLGPPGAVIAGAGAVLVATVLCAAIGARIGNALLAKRRARDNALIVQIAEHAPEDDGDEHECEKHTHSRTAAPGDSDYEDDTAR